MLPEDSMTVLIETLWNVNMYNGLKILESGESINRNIVECKLGPAAPDHAVVVRINRNIVECKCTYQLFHSPDLM